MTTAQIVVVLSILAIGLYLCWAAAWGDDGLFRE